MKVIKQVLLNYLIKMKAQKFKEKTPGL